jgi:hypothetical protein
MASERHREETEVRGEVRKIGEAEEEAGAKTGRLINDLLF